MVEILKELCGSAIDFDDIFKASADKMTISLKEGTVKSFDISLEGKDIAIDLLYNKTFAKNKSDYMSYSVELRPDYSLNIHIGEKDYLIHFDAKYKLNIEDESFKNQDIVKMHAYKDAILGTVGAYVLYPGEKNKIYYENRDEKLESVGAFPLRPGDNLHNRKKISEFIYKKIVDLSDLN